MFIYCENNPISRIDSGGDRWTHVIEETKTKTIEEKESGATFQTTIVYTSTKTNWFGKEIDSKETTATFVFSISNDGAIAFDNTQDSARHLKNSTVRDKLAEEMYNNCISRVDNSLSKRTVEGISSELYWNYVIRDTGPGETANIGGRGKNVPGKDSNAWLFEWLS
jgi:hypothetical protein